MNKRKFNIVKVVLFSDSLRGEIFLQARNWKSCMHLHFERCSASLLHVLVRWIPCLLFRLFHTLLLSYVFHFMCCLLIWNSFYNKIFLHFFQRYGFRIDAQNGDARKSFARRDAQWIMWVGVQMVGRTTTPETEMPEATAALMSATQIPSALQCQQRQGYLWTPASIPCTPFRNLSPRWLKIIGKTSQPFELNNLLIKIYFNLVQCRRLWDRWPHNACNSAMAIHTCSQTHCIH